MTADDGVAVNHQTAPYPTELFELVRRCSYRHWSLGLHDIDRGQGSAGLTLVITTKGFDAYHDNRGEDYRVHHYMPVPPASFNEASWQRWLFEQLALVERHECCEFFAIDGERPYAPHHGPGNDPYIVWDHGSDLDRRTSFLGELNPPSREDPP